MRPIHEAILPALLAGFSLPAFGAAQTPTQHLLESPTDGFFGHAIGATDFAFIVGAPYEDTAGPDSGAAYVYELVGPSLAETAHLTPAPGTIGALFGFSVAIDGNTALVGAPSENGAGAVHVFERIAGGWQETALLTAQDGALGDAFGYAVELEGDTAIVGAPDHDHSAANTGAAYVFVRAGGAWFQQAELVASDGLADDRLGTSVSVDGDLALAGAPGTRAGAIGAGAAYVYGRSGSGSAATWSQHAKLSASDAEAFDALGSAVALLGTRALIGAPLEDALGATDSGSAYVFDQLPTGAWGESAKLVASDGASFDGYATSLSLSLDRALIGAPWDDDDGPGSGAAYVHAFDGSSWSEVEKLTREGAGASENFGFCVSSAGEILAVGIAHADEFPQFPDGGMGWIQAPCWYGSEDCNNNDTKDWCDIQNGTSNDCNGNYIPDECEAWQCKIEIVFLLDTSSSMCDESDTLCSEIAEIDCMLYTAIGTSARSHFYGISDTNFCNASDCNGAVTKTVLGEFGPIVPGNPPCCGVLNDCSQAGGQILSGPKENWGPATAIVAEHFPWTPGAVRLIVPISDEAPWCGEPCDDPGGDLDMVVHAIGIANANLVTVSPVLGDGTSACTAALANMMASGTGGSVFASLNAQADLLDGVIAIVDDVCGPEGDIIICHGESACPCGNDAPPGSGTGCLNSTGAGARMRTSGSSSLTADDLRITTSQLPAGQFGIVFMGPGQAAAVPLGDGQRCVTPAGGAAGQSGLWRFPVANSGSIAVIALGPGIASLASTTFGAGGQILAGESWNFQLWYRDPQGPCGAGNNVSNGIGVTFTP